MESLGVGHIANQEPHGLRLIADQCRGNDDVSRLGSTGILVKVDDFQIVVPVKLPLTELLYMGNGVHRSRRSAGNEQGQAVTRSGQGLVAFAARPGGERPDLLERAPGWKGLRESSLLGQGADAPKSAGQLSGPPRQAAASL